MHTILKCVHVDAENPRFTVGKTYKRDQYGWTDTDSKSRVWLPPTPSVSYAFRPSANIRSDRGKIVIDDETLWAKLVKIT